MRMTPSRLATLSRVSISVGVGRYVRQTPAPIGYNYEPGRSGTLWLKVLNMLIPVAPRARYSLASRRSTASPPSPPSPPSPKQVLFLRGNLP